MLSVAKVAKAGTMTAPVDIGGADASDCASVIGHVWPVHWDLDCGNNTQSTRRSCRDCKSSQRHLIHGAATDATSLVGDLVQIRP